MNPVGKPVTVLTSPKNVQFVVAVERIEWYVRPPLFATAWRSPATSELDAMVKDSELAVAPLTLPHAEKVPFGARAMCSSVFCEPPSGRTTTMWSVPLITVQLALLSRLLLTREKGVQLPSARRIVW